MNAKSSTSTPATVILGCSKCGSPLPDDAQFCAKCGKSVSAPKSSHVVEVLPEASVPTAHHRSRLVLWLTLLLLVSAFVWITTSDSSTAQDIQSMVGWKHDQIIIDESMAVSPHSFRYYKFSLPEGSLNVAIVGDFTSTAAPSAPVPKSAKPASDAPDNDIQVLVLSEPAFTIWQNGFATASVYDSGKVSQGKLQSDIPAGAGIYYLVFSNRASLKTARSVHANIVLRYKNWLPDWFRRIKESFLNWASLD